MYPQKKKSSSFSYKFVKVLILYYFYNITCSSHTSSNSWPIVFNNRYAILYLGRFIVALTIKSPWCSFKESESYSHHPCVPTPNYLVFQLQKLLCSSALHRYSDDTDTYIHRHTHKWKILKDFLFKKILNFYNRKWALGISTSPSFMKFA